MQKMMALLLAELRREHPSEIIPKPQLLDTIVHLCHRNIQFYRAVKDYPVFRKGMANMFGEYCTLDDIDDILRRAAISIVVEDYTFSVGYYPQDLFIRNTDEMSSFVDSIMEATADRRPRRRLADAKFFCVGSCFATNVAYYLSKQGGSVHTTVLAESINSPRNNVDLFHFLETGERRGLLLLDDIAEKFASGELRAAFDAADTLVLTLGCAYSLSSAEGQPLGRMEPGAQFDKPTTAAIAGYLRSIFAVCRRRGFREIYVTVSPVPLSGTLVHASNPYISDSASKSMLRAAIEELRDEPDMQYIPSFEVFRQAALHTCFPTLGLGDGNSRHVNPDITERVIQAFVQNNFDTSAT